MSAGAYFANLAWISWRLPAVSIFASLPAIALSAPASSAARSTPRVTPATPMPCSPRGNKQSSLKLFAGRGQSFPGEDLGGGTGHDLDRGGHENVDSLVVPLGVRREEEETVPVGAVGEGVAAEQLAVLEADGQLLALRGRRRSGDEAAQVLALGIAGVALHEENRLQELAGDLHGRPAVGGDEMEDGADRIEILARPLGDLPVEIVDYDTRGVGHGGSPARILSLFGAIPKRQPEGRPRATGAGMPGGSGLAGPIDSAGWRGAFPGR